MDNNITLVRIFKCLDSIGSLVMCSEVSKQWMVCCNDKSIWESWWSQCWESAEMRWILPSLMQSLPNSVPFSRNKRCFGLLWQTVFKEKRTLGILKRHDDKEDNIQKMLQVCNAVVFYRNESPHTKVVRSDQGSSYYMEGVHEHPPATFQVMYVVSKSNRHRAFGVRVLVTDSVESMCCLLCQGRVRCLIALEDARILHDCFKLLGLPLEQSPSCMFDVPLYLVPPSSWASLADVEDQAWIDILTDPERLESVERSFGFGPAAALDVHHMDNQKRIRAHTAWDPTNLFSCPTFPEIRVWVGGANPHSGCYFKGDRAFDRFEQAGNVLTAHGWNVHSDDEKLKSLALAWSKEVLFPHCHVEPGSSMHHDKHHHSKFGDMVKQFARVFSSNTSATAAAAAAASSSSSSSSSSTTTTTTAAASTAASSSHDSNAHTLPDAVMAPFVRIEALTPSNTPFLSTSPSFSTFANQKKVTVQMWLRVPHVMDKSFTRQEQELVFGSMFLSVEIIFAGHLPKIAVSTKQTIRGSEVGTLSAILGKLKDVTNPSIQFEHKKRFALPAPKVLRRELEVEPIALSQPSLSLSEHPSSHELDMNGRQRSWSFGGTGPNTRGCTREMSFPLAADAVIDPIREEALVDLEDDILLHEDINNTNDDDDEDFPGPLLLQLQALRMNPRRSAP